MKISRDRRLREESKLVIQRPRKQLKIGWANIRVSRERRMREGSISWMGNGPMIA